MYFKTTSQFWLNLQNDLAKAEELKIPEIAPYEPAMALGGGLEV